MLHVIIIGVIEEDSIVCGFANVCPSSGTNSKIIASEKDGTGFTLLAHIFSNSQDFPQDEKGQRATDLLIIPLELLQDVFARIRIVNQGISL